MSLQLLHMNLFDPFRPMSFGSNYYPFVVVHDYSHYTQIPFFCHKNDVFGSFQKLAKMISNEKRFVFNITYIIFFMLHELHIKMGKWARKNRSFENTVMATLNEINLPKYFFVDVIGISCNVMNIVLIRFLS